MPRLRRFFRRRTEKRDAEQPQEAPPLPWLASSTTHDPTSWKPTRQTNSLFALPYDIRHLIFKEVLGARKIHIDLRFRLPDHTLESSRGRGPLHGGYPPLIHWNEPNRVLSSTRIEDLAWRWYHCVCHREPPGLARPERFYRDGCLEGEALCQGSSWTFDACQIGCMGLLLSCKQAHNEGLEILYGTNTIIMETMPFIEAICSESSPMPCRLLGPGVAALTSLQLRVDLTLFSSERQKETDDRSRFELLPNGITSRFPNLARLEIIFELDLYTAETAPWNNMEAVETHLLKPLLAASEQPKRLDICIAIPDSVYEGILTGLRRQHKDTERETTWKMSNLWMRYPPENNWRPTSSVRGYWVKVGECCDRGWRCDGTMFTMRNTALYG